MDKPKTGSVNVDPQTDIVLIFRGAENVNVKVDGEWAISDGNAVDPFVITKDDRYNGTYKVGIRRRGGLNRRGILVQAWSDNDHTLNNRFYVRGARVESGYNGLSFHSHARARGGLFGIKEGMWHMPNGKRVEVPSGIGRGYAISNGGDFFGVYPGASLLIDSNLDIRKITPYAFNNWNDFDVRQNVMVIACDDKSVIIWGDEMHIWNFGSKKARITKDLVSFGTGDVTAHMPSNYKPTPAEINLDDMYVTKLDGGEWDHEFEDYMHVWWKRDKFAIMHNPNVYTGQSDSIMWTKDDIKAPIESVKIVDAKHVLVNDNIHVNTKFPEVAYL